VILVLFMSLSPFTNSGHGSTALRLELGNLDPDSRAFFSRSTRATGYVALGLLGLTLLVGPANLLLRRRNPVSSYLRRDIGTWTVILSVVHVILGFRAGHGGRGVSRVLDFFFANGRPLINRVGLGNWTGLASLVILAGLLAISANSAVRELKGRRWKNLQRLNYTAFALVVLHSVFYGALGMTSPFAAVFIFMLVAVLAGQAVGVVLWRRRHSSTAPLRAP
jgi:methionine sulfoxide reductase heme-binding subunit